ncbi:MAG TPA: dTDP-4-dehydrorhamnose reductase [Acidiferrobacter sp.]|nr:dTDP-4-dehydrorhamnose reductase [Acidiferrobacter sp.]
MTDSQARKGIVIFGASGQLGRALARALAGLGPVTALSHSECDVGDSQALRAVVTRLAPGILINASAYTAVDKAEDERVAAFHINGVAPGLMADVALLSGAWLIHYSTDYVFDGRASRPYVETDPTSPLSVYGESKQMGEAAVLARPIVGFVLRTAWLYDRGGRNFLTTVARLAAAGPLRIVADQFGTPTSVDALADATRALIVHPEARHKGGLYHATCSGHTSWYGFAQAIVDALGLYVPVTAIGTEDYPTKAARPAYSVLANTKLQTAFDIALPPWGVALAAAVRKAP